MKVKEANEEKITLEISWATFFTITKAIDAVVQEYEILDEQIISRSLDELIAIDDELTDIVDKTLDDEGNIISA